MVYDKMHANASELKEIIEDLSAPIIFQLGRTEVQDEVRNGLFVSWITLIYSANTPNQAGRFIRQLNQDYADDLQNNINWKAVLYIANLAGNVRTYNGNIPLPEEVSTTMNPFLFEYFCATHPDYHKNGNRFPFVLNMEDFFDKNIEVIFFRADSLRNTLSAIQRF